MPANVAHFLEEKAASQGAGMAVLAPVGRERDGAIRYRRRTFGELEGDVCAAARMFRHQGIRRGTRVLLMVRPGLDLIRCVFALFKLGAVPVVIDPGMGLRSFLNCVRGASPEALVGIPRAGWVARLFPSSFASIRARVVVGRRFERVLERHRPEGPLAVVDSEEDETAAVLFTSGSTGPAKGVVYAHGMFASQVRAIRGQYGIEPGEVDLPMLPVFALFNPALGMCTVVPEMDPSRPARVDPEKIVRAIQQNGVTNSFGSPALWKRIVAYCEDRSIRLAGLRRVLMAGAPAPVWLLRRLQAIMPDGEVHTPYGATEALPVSSISASEVVEKTARRTSEGAGTCVGKPLPGVDVRIIRPVDGSLRDIDSAETLPVGETGEIVVRGPSVTRSYDRRPDADATAKIRSAGGGWWHRMGDLGYLDGEGRIWFCGRKVEHVPTASGPLYTECVEPLFNAHPRVARSALIGLPAIDGSLYPALVVEPEAGMYPKVDTDQKVFRGELEELAARQEGTAMIKTFFFERSFPVDVRHNAKIHRLSLARKHSPRESEGRAS